MEPDALALVRDVIKRAREWERTAELLQDRNRIVTQPRGQGKRQALANVQRLARLGGPAAVDVAERLLYRSQEQHRRAVVAAESWARTQLEPWRGDREALLAWARQAEVSDAR